MLSLSPFPPAVVTDCQGILKGLLSGPAATTKPDKKLARTWQLVRAALDDDFANAAVLLTWMPAHCSAAAIGNAVMSNGCTVTALHWRANRLVDLLAKAAANEYRLPKAVCRFVEDAAKLVQHHAACSCDQGGERACPNPDAAGWHRPQPRRQGLNCHWTSPG